MRPSWLPVCALKPLQNSMMLTPCWPSAGPTGGDGFALPAVIWSLTIAWTLFAITVCLRSPRSVRDARPVSPLGSRARSPRSAVPRRPLQALHLVVLELDRGRPAEHGHHDLHASTLGMHVLHDTLEVHERAVDDANLVHALEDRLGLGLLRARLHLPKDLVDLVLGQGHRT